MFCRNSSFSLRNNSNFCWHCDFSNSTLSHRVKEINNVLFVYSVSTCYESELAPSCLMAHRIFCHFQPIHLNHALYTGFGNKVVGVPHRWYPMGYPQVIFFPEKSCFRALFWSFLAFLMKIWQYPNCFSQNCTILKVFGKFGSYLDGFLGIFENS